MHKSAEWLLVLAALAGAIHVIAPDHWVPLSLLSWRSRWKNSKTLALAVLGYLGHIALGFAIYVLLAFSMTVVGLNLAPARLFTFAVALVLLGTGLRAARFSRVSDVLTIGGNKLWGVMTVFSLLGPCESLIPVLLKAKIIGIGYLLPLAAFGIGTLVAGVGLTLAGHFVWDEPLRLSSTVAWVDRRRTALPILAGVMAGLVILVRLGG